MSPVVRSGHRTSAAPPANSRSRLYSHASAGITAFLLLALTCCFSFRARAGGSGLNVLVVVNQDSTNSCELGNYYLERRQIGPENLLRIFWPGDNISWSGSDFTNVLLNPLLSMLATRQLTNQVDYVVLSMDIPFKTINGSNANSTTAALFYGLKPDASDNYNSYAGSETGFHSARPVTLGGYSFLSTMLTANSIAQAKNLVDQGVLSDSSFPGAPSILEKTSDPMRNVRYSQFDNAIFNLHLLGRGAIMRTNSDMLPGAPVFGFQTGLANFTVITNTFLPGAMADSLTSYGGIIFGPNSQSSLLSFITGGASGSYGTVDEPFSDPQKFPNSQDYFYQARGFNLAEAYYQSINVPYLGLVVAEPLAAPFAQPGQVKWLNVASNAVLSGSFCISNSASASRPLQRMDLFVDGEFFQTLTNLGPQPGNVLSVALEGYPISYTVPANATLGSIVTGLVQRINIPWLTNITKVQAFTRGDRIELRSMSTNFLADPFYYVDRWATNGTNFSYRVNYLPFPDRPQFNSVGMDPLAGYRMRLETMPGVPCVVFASTNLMDWVAIATNTDGGEKVLFDSATKSFPRRFYRLASPDIRPRLSLATNGTGLSLHIQTQTALAYVIQASTNLLDWIPIWTNATGAAMDLLQSDYTNFSARFYRVEILPPTLPPAGLAVVTNPPSGGNLISVFNPSRAYTVDVWTNGQWVSLLTNSTLSGGQVSARSSLGTADDVSTFVSAAQNLFMDSPALGWRAYYLDGSAQIGSWLRLDVIKTNGVTISVNVTNQNATGTLATLTSQLLIALANEPALQGNDGAIGDDYAVDAFGGTSFHLYARSAGLAAAGLKAQLSASADLSVSPSSVLPLNQNMSDLQPRNHLYVTAGANLLNATCLLDTTKLADGYHELTAVAYEGSSIATQTKATVPVQIQNTPLTATLTLLDLADTDSTQGTYHLQVTANTNNISAITLFSTGGALAAALNQSSVIFTLDASVLAAGRHPFYALVQTGDGLQYRTETHWVRLQ